jgi:glutamate racemase
VQASSRTEGTTINAPIGIFDSGIGGLSVLRHVRALLPQEDLLYVADSGFAPYGSKSEEALVARAVAIAAFMSQRKAKALVLACNTATAAAIRELRHLYPALPVVGVEPGLKPAAALTRSRVVGVLATAATLASDKFKQLQEQIATATQVRFVLQPCVGLADQVDKGELDSSATTVMVERYLAPLLEEGADTLVLGCTHYPFVQPLIEACIARKICDPLERIAIIDTGEAVARQLARLLDQHGLVRPSEHAGSLEGFSTGDVTVLGSSFESLLKLQPRVSHIAL